ncbi:MAG: hypothetical protein RLZZ303_3170 [Candidatus Hydrogenedentota bacterium]|jgi:apolipoprotein N-acyltransferase
MRRALTVYLVPLASGLCLSLCFPSLHLYYLVWVALAPLVYVSSLEPCVRRGALQWFLAGWMFHSFLLQWLMANIFWAGGWAVLGYQLLVLALALFWGFLGAGWSYLLRRRPSFGAPLLAGLFLAVEWMHANFATGFGWSALAYSQGPNLALLQWAALGGAALVALPIIYANAAIGLFFARTPGRWGHLIAAAVVAVAMHLGGAAMLDLPNYKSQPLKAAVFQSNYTNEMKWDGEYTIDMVERAASHSAKLEEFQPLDLMVWPEALVMYDYQHPELFGWMKEYAASQDTALLTGTVRYEDNRNYNSSVLLSRVGEVAGYYDKVHLVPFGEYVPFEEYLGFVQQVVQSSVDHGVDQKVLETDGIRIGPLICFEVLYPGMSQRLRAGGAQVLAVMTNLAWFGSSSAIAQEIEIARLRSVESRLPLLHASNTGVSGAFDPWGRFSAVDTWVTASGRLVQRDPDALLTGTAAGLRMAHRRALGAFDVAAPAHHPFPGGPVLTPLILLFLTALLCGAVFLPMPRWPLPQESTPEAPPMTPQVASAEKPSSEVFPTPPDDISI